MRQAGDRKTARAAKGCEPGGERPKAGHHRTPSATAGSFAVPRQTSVKPIGAVAVPRVACTDPRWLLDLSATPWTPLYHPGMGVTPGRQASHYDGAEVCLNGHVINDRAASRPEVNQPFCSRCGARTIRACPGCGASIRGHLHIPRIAYSGLPMSAPAHCHNCGDAYPWFAERLLAAKELAREMMWLNEDDRALLERSLDDIVRDTPRTGAAAMRVKRLLTKASVEIAKVFRDAVQDIATAEAHKVIWGP